MSTIQRSESMNALFNGYVNNHTSIYQFVRQYKGIAESRYAREDEQFKTLALKPKLWLAYIMEKHA